MLYIAITKATMYEANSVIHNCAKGLMIHQMKAYGVYCLNISIVCLNNFVQVNLDMTDHCTTDFCI